jgi:hypothetical protein
MRNEKYALRDTQYAIRNSIISWRTQTAVPVRVNGRTITPQSQVLQIRLPFGGFVWHRPLAVLVEEGDGEPEAASGRTQTIPITDVTRRALWTLLALTILVNLFVFMRRPNQ